MFPLAWPKKLRVKSGGRRGSVTGRIVVDAPTTRPQPGGEQLGGPHCQHSYQTRTATTVGSLATNCGAPRALFARYRSLALEHGGIGTDAGPFIPAIMRAVRRRAGGGAQDDDRLDEAVQRSVRTGAIGQGHCQRWQRRCMKTPIVRRDGIIM